MALVPEQPDLRCVGHRELESRILRLETQVLRHGRRLSRVLQRLETHTARLELLEDGE